LIKLDIIVNLEWAKSFYLIG